MDPSEYCREIETYLCRKNEGHLIRIVGPAFEQVSGWAAQGVPLKVAFRGIDQYCERYYAKGPRRRPVRIEFCEADILDLFDAWRRAIGVTGIGAAQEDAEPAPRKPALASHIERAIARLTTARRGHRRSAEFDGALADAIRELDDLQPDARHARGEGRARIIGRLSELDRQVLDIAFAEIDRDRADAIRREAVAELAPFGARMASDARDRAVEAAYARLVREEFGLPVIAFE